MPPGDDSGETRSATPTDQPGQAHDAGVTTPDTALTTPAGSTPPPSPEPATATPAANGASAAKPATPVPDDPVRAAIARLARDGGSAQPRDDQGRFTAAEQAAAAIAKAAGKPAPAKPATPPAAAPAAAKPAAPAATPTPGVDTDPYHGFDDREKAALNGRTKARIEELNQRWRSAEAERSKLAAAGSQPDEFTELVKQHQLENDVGFVPADHLAGLMRAQAAIVRSQIAAQQGRRPAAGDLQAASKFFETIDAVRGQLGLAKPAPTAAEIQPFKGDLPKEAAELVEIYGLPEADVRLLVALKARQAGTAVAGGPPTARPAAPVQAPPMTAPQGEGVDMDRLYGQRFIADLTREGVQPAMVKAHFQMLLPLAAAITQTRFPGVSAERVAAVFDALPPQERYNILVEAQRDYRAKSTPQVRPSTPPPPASPPGLNGSAPRRSAPAANGDPVAAAVAFLARPG